MAPASSAWKYFTKQAEGVQCKRCKKVLKRKDSSTKVLWSHLRVHPDIISGEKGEQKGKEEVGQASTSQDDIPQAPTAQVGILACFEQSRSLVKKSSEELDEVVARMLVSANLPFSFVENEDFIALITSGHPSYKLKKRKFYSETVIPLLCEKALRSVVSSLDRRPFAVTSDEWSHGSISLLSMTAHVLDGENGGRMDAVLAACPFSDVAHNARNTAERIRTVMVMRNLRMDQISCIVRDDARYMINACEVLGVESFQCLAHCLHLFVKKSMFTQNSITSVIAKCRSIATHFNHSATAQGTFRKLQEVKGIRQRMIPQDVSTRWNSTFSLIECIIEQRRALKAYLIHQRTKKKPLASEIPELSNKEYEILTKLLPILDAVKQESERVCTEHSSAGVYIPTLCALLSFLERLNTNTECISLRSTVDSMITHLKERADKAKENKILRLCALGDPRFKYSPSYFSIEEWSRIDVELVDYGWQWQLKRKQWSFPDVDSEESSQPVSPAHSILDDEGGAESGDEIDSSSLGGYINCNSSEDDSSDDGDAFLVEAVGPVVSKNVDIWAKPKTPVQEEPMDAECDTEEVAYACSFKFELAQYKRMKNVDRFGSIYQFFDVNAASLPHLVPVLRQLAAVPPTSVQSERLFSKSGLMYANRLRNRLSAEKAEEMLIVKANIKRVWNVLGVPLLDTQNENGSDCESDDI